MEPISSDMIMTGHEWIYQIKWDGIRGLVYYQDSGPDKLKIYTKRGRDRTVYYPELHHIIDRIAGNSAILDGEIVVPGEDSKPTFQLSLIRERVSNPDRLLYYSSKYPVIYIIFDILYINGSSLTGLPFMKRRDILYNTVKSGVNIGLAENYKDGPGLFNLMKRKGWEGIVSKKKDSPYLPGKNHRDWFKHKVLKKMLAAVCGIQLKNGFPNSLILGINRDNEWVYIGKASLGLTQDDLAKLKEYSQSSRDECPFTDANSWKGKPVKWLKPTLTCWVRFLEWTNDGQLRHPRILGFAASHAEEADGREWSMDE